MTYNIKGFWLKFDGEPGVMTLESGRLSIKDLERLNIISSVISSKQPDVIAIQECAGLIELQYFNKQFLDKQYKCWSFRAVDNRLEGIPLGLIVKKDLQVHSIELFEPNSFSRRGIIIADISKDDYRFTLISVHLKSKIEETLGESATKRHNQCLRLREVMKERLEDM